MVRLPHLETNVTSACQNRCVACNHFVPLQEGRPFMLDPDVMRRDLTYFSRVCHVDKYGMLGGEPTLHPKLPELISIAADSGVANEIEVWTNGQRLVEVQPFRQSAAFWEAPFHALVVTAYPGKLRADEIDHLREMCNLWGKRFELKDERNYPNFTQLLKPQAERAQETYNACWFKTFSRVLDNGYFYRCCTSPYIPKLLLGKPEGTDGLRVDEHLSEEALLAFLNQPEAMESCGICAGRNTRDAVPIPWREIRDPQRWLNVSSGRPE